MKTTSMRLLSMLVLVILALGVLAACLTPQPTPVVIDSQAVQAQEEFKTIRVKGLSDLRGILTVGGSATFNGSATFLVTPTMPSLTVNGVTQSGAIKYGTASTVISGTAVAHGIGTTPTLFLPMNATAQTAVFTQSLYAPAALCNTVSCTIYVSQGSITTFTTVKWIAGY